MSTNGEKDSGAVGCLTIIISVVVAALARLGVECRSYYLLSVLRVRGTNLAVGLSGYVWLKD